MIPSKVRYGMFTTKNKNSCNLWKCPYLGIPNLLYRMFYIYKKNNFFWVS